MFYEAAYGVEDLLVQRSKEGLTYLAVQDSGVLQYKMEHLACFAGGLFGQAATEDDNYNRWRETENLHTRRCKK